MTEEEKYGMERLAEYLDMRIRNEEKSIKENRDKLDRDYLYHFAWNGEELFKSHFMVKRYGELRQVIWHIPTGWNVCRDWSRIMRASNGFCP